MKQQSGIENTIVCNSELSSGDLSNFVESYIFRRIRLNAGAPIIKFMPSRHANSIDFYLGDDYETQDLKTGLFVPFMRSTIRGPRTFKKYKIVIRGNFISFSIKFKPSGIYQIFGIPMDNFRDEATDAKLIHPNFFCELTERLMGCNDIQSCIAIAEKYLLKLVSNNTHTPSVVSSLAEFILKSDNSTPVNELYKKLPLTARQLERNFAKEIGVPPKTYSSLVRFEKILSKRINKPNTDWTELAYEHNYFDQMHLIKDFHKFLDICPRKFSPGDFAL